MGLRHWPWSSEEVELQEVQRGIPLGVRGARAVKIV